jgi:VWFA-related protein
VRGNEGLAAGAWVAVLAVVATAGVGVRGQDQPPLRTGVQVVQIDARVFDPQGRFVADLTREEFELLENGAPQAIQQLFLVEEAAGPAAVTPAGPAASPGEARAPLARARQTWVFFFDLPNLTPGGGFDRARQAVQQFIADRFQDGDLAGIVAGDKMVNNKLTTVREELLAGLKQVQPRSDARTRWLELTREWPRLTDAEEAIRIARNERDPLQQAVARACAEEPEQCRAADMIVRDKGIRIARDIQRASLDTMTAINALASGLARIPGPKTVVFLSDGFVVQDIETTLRSVVGQMARAGARVYSIDARGLGRLGAPGPEQLAAEDPAGASTRFDSLGDAPNSLAIDTGGLMIRNENNIGRALDTIARDAGRYYLLAYQPSNTTWDGTFRQVEVRVKRPDVRVRARRGYIALDPAQMLAPGRAPVAAPPVVDPPAGAPLAGVPPSPGAPDAVAPPSAGAPDAVARPSAGAPDAVAPPAPVGAALAAAPPSIEASPPATIRLRPDAARQVEALAGGAIADAADLATVGWTAYQRGDLEAALEPLAQAAEAANPRPWVLYALGMAQAGLGQTGQALASWERVRLAAPHFEAVYFDLAATYAHLSDLTRALDVLRDAERRWPANADVHNGIGVIHVRRGALDDAIAAFTRAADSAPGDSLAHFNLARAYELRYGRSQRYVSSQRRWTTSDGDRRQAIEHYETYLKMGGPHVAEVRAALLRLEWSK